MSNRSQNQLAAGDMRDAPRKHVLMQATIISPDGPHRAFIKDLAMTGARIQCDEPLKEGWDVVFERGDDFRAARVVWSTKDEAGLQFYRDAEREDCAG
jgi:hypothetical protein